jgi:hypothetical protein
MNFLQCDIPLVSLMNKITKNQRRERGGGAAPDTGETSVYSSFDRHQLLILNLDQEIS